VLSGASDDGSALGTSSASELAGVLSMAEVSVAGGFSCAATILGLNPLTAMKEVSTIVVVSFLITTLLYKSQKHVPHKW
jgi:hypothetical protein